MSSDGDDNSGSDAAITGSLASSVMKWSAAKAVCYPTQRALGWDWTLFKLSHFVSFEEAQEYMARKPVPFVSYRGKNFVVDHHHTLVGSSTVSHALFLTIPGPLCFCSTRVYFAYRLLCANQEK